MTGVEHIALERQRQIDEEGWSAEHDAQHTFQELARLAACYAIPPNMRENLVDIEYIFPFECQYWKPSPDNRVRELVKAGALIAAEIDRLQAAGGE